MASVPFQASMNDNTTRAASGREASPSASNYASIEHQPSELLRKLMSQLNLDPTAPPPPPPPPNIPWYRRLWTSTIRVIGPPQNLTYEQLVVGLPFFSLGYFNRYHPLRKFSITLTRARGFEAFVLLIILCNCICLAMSSNRPGFAESATARSLVYADYFFSAVFATEMVFKIVALGLVRTSGAYLRDGFNILDAIVVLLGFINYIPSVGNYTAIRALRVLRPLRTIVKIKGLKRLVTSLLLSLPLLLDVMLLFAFLLFVYGIAAVQIFGGALRHKCAEMVLDPGFLRNASLGDDVSRYVQWNVVDDDDSFCSGPFVSREVQWRVVKENVWSPRHVISSVPLAPGDGRHCPLNEYCIDTHNNPAYNISSFDNIGAAWLNIFITITMDGWSDIFYQLEEAVSPYVWPFFASLIAFGSFFLVNLTLAILYANFRTTHNATSNESDVEEDGDGMHSMSISAGSSRDDDDEDHYRDRGGSSAITSPLSKQMLTSPRKSSAIHAVDPSAVLSREALNALKAKLLNPTDPLREVRRSLVRIDSDFTRVAMAAVSVKKVSPNRPLRLLPSIESSTASNVFDLLAKENEEREREKAKQEAAVQPLKRREHTLVRLLRLYSYHLLALPGFDSFMVFLVLFNVFIMAAQHAHQPAWQDQMTNIVNYIVTAFFVIEVVSKHIAYGWKVYWSDGYDIFDALVTAASIVDILVSSSVSANGSGSALGALRALRLMRLLKLARQWKELQRILDTIFRALGSILYTATLLLLYLFVYSLLGMQLYGDKFQFCDNIPNSVQKCPPQGACPRYRDCWLPCSADERGTWVNPPSGSTYYGWAYCEAFPNTNESWMNVGPAYVPRFNFDSFFWSFITVFVCLVQDGWSDIMYDAMRSCGYQNVIYFISLMLIGMYVLLSLFLAIILDGFGAAREEDVQREIDRGKLAVLGHRFSNFRSNVKDKWKKFWSKRGATVIPVVLNEEEGRMSSGEVEEKKFRFWERWEHWMWWRKEGRESDFIVMVNEDDPDAPPQPLDGWSLLCFSPSNPMRQRCAQLVLHPYFELVVMTIIVASSLALALDHPLLNPASNFKRHLRNLDMFFLIVFTMELVLKVIVFGLVFTRRAYLKSPWNWLDLLIVVIAFLIETLPDNQQTSIRYLRALRTFRALRPLRVVTWNPGMRVVVAALLQSIPPLGDVLLVSMLVYLVFGVLGINLLAGKMGTCVDITPGSSTYGLPLDPALFPTHQLSRAWCESNGGVHQFPSFAYHTTANLPSLPQPLELLTKWKNSPANFDNIGNALLTLYEISSLELWEDYMLLGVDARDKPEDGFTRDSNPYIAIYFLAAIFTISFFIMNLVVGVVIDKYNELKEKHEGNGVLLTSDQARWVQVQKLLGLVTPRRLFAKPKSPWRSKLYDFVFSQRFEQFIMLVIVLNILQMAVDAYDASTTWFQTLSAFNIVFTAIFLVEIVAKFLAIGPRWFFRDRMLIFDLVVVAVSIGTILGDYADGTASKDGAGAGINLLRIARLARVLRLVPKAKSLHNLVQTLVYSMPALWNVGSVMFLFMFVYGIMGMQLFGASMHGDFLTYREGFATFPTAILMLFRTLTGENWPGVMHDASNDYAMDKSYCMQVVSNCNVPMCTAPLQAGLFYTLSQIETANAPLDYVIDRCAPPRAASIIFFFTFTLLCGYLMLNLIIAIIIDNFQWARSEEDLPVKRVDLQIFVDAWAQLDPFGSGVMATRHLSRLLALLDPPMGVRGTGNETMPHIEMIIMSCDIPNRKGRVTFIETLHALSARIAGADLPPAARQRLEDEMAGLVPRNAVDADSNAAHFHAALIVKAAVRGLLVRSKTGGVGTRRRLIGIAE